MISLMRLGSVTSVLAGAEPSSWNFLAPGRTLRSSEPTALL